MACHLDVIAKEAETTALYVGQARFQILKERVQRLRAQLTGSRFGRGVIVPGGVRHEGLIGLDEIAAALDALERDLARDRELFLGTASMTDRLIGAGRARATADRGATARSGRSHAARGCRPTPGTSGRMAITTGSACASSSAREATRWRASTFASASSASRCGCAPGDRPSASR